MLSRRVQAALDLFRVGAVIEPGEIRLDERARRFTCRSREHHRALKIRLKLWLDGAPRGSTPRSDHLRELKHPARNLDRALQGAGKGLGVVVSGGLDDAGKRRGVLFNQEKASMSNRS